MPESMTEITDMRRYSNALRLLSEKRIEAITQRLVNGEIDLATWQEEMKAELRKANLEQYITGRGGETGGIRRTDYLQLGPELKRQYKYLRRFAAVIEKASDSEKSLAFAVSRAMLYAKSTQAMFWRSALPINLPQVPRDGKTRCRTNCKCRLQFQYERDENGAIIAVLVFWKLGPTEHCPDCLQLARTWNPKRFEVSTATESAILQAIAVMLMESPELSAREFLSMWDYQEDSLCQV